MHFLLVTAPLCREQVFVCSASPLPLLCLLGVFLMDVVAPFCSSLYNSPALFFCSFNTLYQSMDSVTKIGIPLIMLHVSFSAGVYELFMLIHTNLVNSS